MEQNFVITTVDDSFIVTSNFNTLKTLTLIEALGYDTISIIPNKGKFSKENIKYVFLK